MTTDSEEHLVHILTKEVLRRLAPGAMQSAAPVPVLAPAPTETADKTRTPRRNHALVLGNPDGLCLEGGWIIETENDYKTDARIEKYDIVYIAAITNAQLCDVALGRDSQPFSCAVVGALLRGIPVRMLSTAPLWLRYVAGAPPALARTLRGYQEKLVTYGVEIVSGLRPSPAHAESGSGAMAAGGRRVVTADLAKQLCAGADEIHLRKGDILTPLARDVFIAAKVKFNWPAR